MVGLFVCLIFATGWAKDRGQQSRGLVGDRSVRQSCFFSVSGARLWCSGPRHVDCTGCPPTWYPCGGRGAVVQKKGGRYEVSLGNAYYGRVRPSGPGLWRASADTGHGRWRRAGTIVRRSSGRWIISRAGVGMIGYSSGPYPVVVGAHELLASPATQCHT